jgi:hypothetical protein
MSRETKCSPGTYDPASCDCSGRRIPVALQASLAEDPHPAGRRSADIFLRPFDCGASDADESSVDCEADEGRRSDCDLRAAARGLREKLRSAGARAPSREDPGRSTANFRRPRIAAAALLTFVLLAAPAAASPKLTDEQARWIAARNRQPTTFVVSAEESDAAFRRAKIWIAKFATLPIGYADDVVIQCQAGTGDWSAEAQYTVTRQQQLDGAWRFDVLARSANPAGRGAILESVRALAYFTASGIPYPETDTARE